MRRVILFVQDISRVGAFYRDVIGLTVKVSPDDERTWLEFDAGACSIALHNGGAPSSGRRPPKIVFFAEGVAQVRAELIARGAKLGKAPSAGEFNLCDGKDPEGNPFSISSRS